MDAMQIGYARVSTTDQDLTAQRDGLLRLGVRDADIYVDHGMTSTNRSRPGLREALAATRSGDTLVVTKLDRLARSLRDAREIADELTAKGVALSRRTLRHLACDRLPRASASASGIPCLMRGTHLLACRGLSACMPTIRSTPIKRRQAHDSSSRRNVRVEGRWGRFPPSPPPH